MRPVVYLMRNVPCVVASLAGAAASGMSQCRRLPKLPLCALSRLPLSELAFYYVSQRGYTGSSWGWRSRRVRLPLIVSRGIPVAMHAFSYHVLLWSTVSGMDGPVIVVVRAACQLVICTRSLWPGM